MYKNPIVDMTPPSDKLAGFWRAIVEDNEDPLLAGRVRVRIHGLHTPNTFKEETDGIPVSELPWAEPCLPIIEGSVSGFGSWNIPIQGSHVMVFFEGMNLTAPRYFATMPGIPEDTSEVRSQRSNPNANQGFRDPDNEYPTLERLGEPDVHRLARGISDDTLVDTKNTNLDIGVSTALGGSWNEPESAFNAKYPDNYVTVTHGGITVEFDSTTGSERIHVYHPSNSYIEIDNEGTMVIRNGGEKYEIVLQGKNVHIKQDHNITVDGNEKRKVSGNQQVEIIENKQEEIGGNEIQNVGGDVEINITGDEDTNITGDQNTTIDGDLSLLVAGSADVEIGEGLDGQIDGAGNIGVDGAMTITVDGLITVVGNGNIVVESGSVQVTGGTIELGAQGTLRKLIDERLIDLFNNHKHGGVSNGGSNSDGPRPGDQLSLANTATVNVEAS